MEEELLQARICAACIPPATGPVRVHPGCEMAALARAMGVPHEAVCLACTYVVRALERHSSPAVLGEQGWLLEGRVCARCPPRCAMETEMLLLYAACIHVATKVLGRPATKWQHSGLVRAIFGRREHPYRQPVNAMELTVAAALDWRLQLRMDAA